MIEKALQKNLTLSSDEFEREFRRSYTDLYPDERTLKKALEYYKKYGPSMQFPYVDENPQVRMDDIRWHMKKKTLEDYEKGHTNSYSSYKFSDIKELIEDKPIDIVHLSPAVVRMPRSPFLDEKSIETNIGKCLCGLKNNDISIGNFSKVLWQRGNRFTDACIRGSAKWQDEPFAIAFSEPTYDRPILVVCNVLEEGTMLGDYHNFLNKKGIGILFTDNYPKIPGFDFIGKTFRDSYRYILDQLSFY